jgi:hypothetical protein
LARSGRQPGAGSHPLDIPDHRRDLRKLAEPNELTHERNARS